MMCRGMMPRFTESLLRRHRAEGAALGAGLLLPLGFAPFNAWPLVILAPALLFLLIHNTTPKRALLRGWLFGLGSFGLGVSWVYVAIHDFGNTGAVLAALLTFIFCAFLALYPALFAWLSARLRQRFGIALIAQLLLLLPLLWALSEWLRGWLLSGFSWLNPGFALVDSPLGGLLQLLGIYGASLGLALVSGALALLWLRRGRCPLAVALMALVLLAGWWGGTQEWVEADAEVVSVSLIQGNVPQQQKWRPEQEQLRLDRYVQMSRERFGRSRLIVWPENALTTFYGDVAPWVLRPLAEEAVEQGSELVIGLPVRREEGDYYTSMVQLAAGEGAASFYHKRHLVPFGEFVPFAPLRALGQIFNLPMSAFRPGAESQPPLQVAGLRASATICYEDAFPDELLASIRGSQLLINGSNNAWYGDSLAPHQHLQIARSLALAVGRPMLRATGNGISAIIDHRGRVLIASAQFKQAIVDGAVQPMRGFTPFLRWGNLPFLLLSAVMALVLFGVLAVPRTSDA